MHSIPQKSTINRSVGSSQGASAGPKPGTSIPCKSCSAGVGILEVTRVFLRMDPRCFRRNCPARTLLIIFVQLRFWFRSKALKFSFQTALKSYSYKNYRLISCWAIPTKAILRCTRITSKISTPAEHHMQMI